MSRFFEIPYWRRVWIIQETAFDREVQLVCGPKDVPFGYLAKTMKIVECYRLGGDLCENLSINSVCQIKDMRSKILASRPISLLEAMTRASRAESSEIKDRLYGLFSLVRFFAIDSALCFAPLEFCPVS